LGTDDRAVVAGFYLFAGCRTAIAILAVPIVANLEAFEQPVAAVGTLTEAAVPPCLRFLATIEATAVTGENVAVIAGFGRGDHAVAALDAPLAGRHARVVRLDLRAVIGATVARLCVAVVAKLVRIEPPVPAQLAGYPGTRADPAAALDLADRAAPVGPVTVAVVASLAAFNDAVAAFEAARTGHLAAPLRPLHLAHIVAAIAETVVTVVTSLPRIERSVAASRFRRPPGARTPGPPRRGEPHLNTRRTGMTRAAGASDRRIEGVFTGPDDDGVILAANERQPEQR